MSFINRLKGEEPGFFTKAVHALQGTCHYGEYLADYALDHGKIPGRGRSFTNLYVPYRGRTSEVDVLFLHETGVCVIESKSRLRLSLLSPQAFVGHRIERNVAHAILLPVSRKRKTQRLDLWIVAFKRAQALGA